MHKKKNWWRTKPDAKGKKDSDRATFALVLYTEVSNKQFDYEIHPPPQNKLTKGQPVKCLVPTYAIVCSLIDNDLAEGPGQLCQLRAAQLFGIGYGSRRQSIPQRLLKVAQLGKGPSQVTQHLHTTAHKVLKLVQLGGKTQISPAWSQNSK